MEHIMCAYIKFTKMDNPLVKYIMGIVLKELIAYEDRRYLYWLGFRGIMLTAPSIEAYQFVRARLCDLCSPNILQEHEGYFKGFWYEMLCAIPGDNAI